MIESIFVTMKMVRMSNLEKEQRLLSVPNLQLIDGLFVTEISQIILTSNTNIFDTEVNKTYRILNVFQNAKYPDTYFFGYCDMSCQDLLQNIDYSTCSEVLQGENGFTIQV
jgi:hypothetical protein